MPRRCTVCAHPNRAEIDQDLVKATEPYRRIAERNELAPSSLLRHRQHIPQVLVSAAGAAEASRADGLLERVQALETDCRRILQVAEAANDRKTAVSAIRELTRLAELLARLSGELKDKSIAVQVNVHSGSAAPEYTQHELEVLARELAAEHLSPRELREIASELDSRNVHLLEGDSA